MPVDNPDLVDLVSLNEAGAIVLTISDHLDWSDSIAHQHALQAKINRYLAFVESGEICERYPDAEKRGVVIRVVRRFEPDSRGRVFLERAQKAVQEAGVGFEHRLFASG